MGIKRIRVGDYIISDGDAGIYETVDYMWNYALRDINEPLVKKLVRSLRGGSDIDTIRNIYNWVWRNVDYKQDPPDRELITSPIHFVNGNRSTGDCDCMTTLLVCLLESAGFDCAIKVIAWRIDEYTHVYAEVWYNGKWLELDPTLKGAGFGKQDKKIRRFKRITKKEMGKLQVLADGESEAPSVMEGNGRISPERYNELRSEILDRHPRCGRRRGFSSGSDDWNRNSNNININFGTTTENAYNSSNSGSAGGSGGDTSGGVPVSPSSLPAMRGVFDFRKYAASRGGGRPTILRSDGNGGWYVDNTGSGGIPGGVPGTNANPGYGGVIGTNANPGSNGIVGSGAGSGVIPGAVYMPGSVGSTSVVRKNSVVKRNYYPEFP